MFGHIYKYTFLSLIRNKNQMFWIVCFPILLGTMFYFGFGNIFDTTEKFDPVPVVVISDNSDNAKDFKAITDELSEEGENKILEIVEADEKEAEKLLETNDIAGILYAGDELSLTVSAEATDREIEQSILSSIISEYNATITSITDVMKDHPENIKAVADSIGESIEFNKEVSYTDNKMDVYVQYFYNLIAMVCLYGSLTGASIVISSQANLSTVGARKSITPLSRFKTVLAELLAAETVQFLCILVSLFYIVGVLKIEFGVSIGFMLLIVLLGSSAGVGLGFMVGSMGHMSENMKTAILMAVSMFCSFLSGLMVGDMRIRVEEICPLLNRINPAAVITDCFYSLSIYDTYNRFTTNVVTLIITTILFIGIGIFITRREKYASL